MPSIPDPVPDTGVPRRPLLRAAALDDAERAGALHHACWVETFAGLASPELWDRLTVDRSVATWRRLLAGGLDATVADLDGALVGVAVAGRAQDRGGHPPVRERELGNLYVLAAHHGTGVGQALLDAVLPPGTRAQVWAARDTPRARRFYERNGFRADGATEDGSTFGGVVSLRLVR
ncbi:GNAT family N-acetyltransferase [Cellulomonas sp. S1-8]|uniref:GNAT family N-acetyltransferase n=1 Tax=Cellulomonas sp. S1-8 TaxID=2904790 RepID=UPI0022439044|nr:GNAT family N-acetyltransferase [Cellulomonas sp. S1-8]UZN03698.1 GNAT family N-acetyltransferase [Cellulomonas sp. S1-8]